MSGYRRPFFAWLLTLVLVLAYAMPATAAAPVQSRRPELLTLDPVPWETTESSVTISGKVLGSFSMQVRNDANTYSLHAHGPFQVTVALHPGYNTIQVAGDAPAGAHVEQWLGIYYKAPPTQLRLTLVGPALVADGTSTTTVTATALDALGNYTPWFEGMVAFSSSNPGAVEVITPEVPRGTGARWNCHGHPQSWHFG
jgi:hypothetical protein